MSLQIKKHPICDCYRSNQIKKSKQQKYFLTWVTCSELPSNINTVDPGSFIKINSIYSLPVSFHSILISQPAWRKWKDKQRRNFVQSIQHKVNDCAGIYFMVFMECILGERDGLQIQHMFNHELWNITTKSPRTHWIINIHTI